LPFTITGQVTDLLTGAPVVAMVRLTENSAIPGIITTKTDPSGRYSITMDPGSFDGNYTIEVTAVGYASKSSTFTIPTNGAMIPLNFVLAKQGILTGHVTQQGGAALGGAKVTVGTSETSTDIAGAYSITVDPGTYSVTASAFGFMSVNRSITIPSGVTVALDFILAATVTGSVTGTVVNENDGSPLSGARVAALGETLTTTDVDGTYTLTNLQPGPTQMTASFGPRFIPDTETVSVISGATVTQDFILVRKGTRI
jgi:hypothetical protein